MKRLRTFLLPIALFSVFALATACGGGDSDDTGDASTTTDTIGTDAGDDTGVPPEDGGGGGCKPEDCIGQVPNLGVCQVAGCGDDGACVAVTAPAGTACDDGDPCTSEDVCDAAGTCGGSPIASCNPCDSTADCAAFEDGDLCNGTLVCEGGTCQLDETTIVECPADSDCAMYVCDSATGTCDMTPTNEGGTCEGDPAVLCDVDFVCENGECVCPGCVPECEGRECGDDGCGGTCEPGCGADETCTEGVCVECTPSCDDRECGDDGCGGSCGTCGDNETCSDAGVCECVPACDGLECGDDGCGGSCGTCGDNETCTAGVCECVPQCGDRECGDDGCGGSCGDCDAGDECSANGVCIPEGCTPDCTGLSCGPDPVCGDSCGTCGAGEECVEGVCELTDACLGVDDIGCCEGDTVIFCQEGVLEAIDCGSFGVTCGWNAEGPFYDCAEEATADPDGTPRECGAFPECPSTCADAGVQCGLHPDCPWLDCGGCDDGQVCDAETGQCTADPCQGVSFEGCCLDGNVVWCEEGAIQSQPCGAAEPCGWLGEQNFFACGGTDTPPAGIDETCPELTCGTTCEEAGVACGQHPECPWVSCGGCDAGQLCSAGACLAVDATDITCDTRLTGTNAGGTSAFDSYGCGYDATGPDVAYALTLDAAGDVFFGFDESAETGVPLAGDLEIYVIGPNGECNFIDTTGTVSLTAGTWYVFVDGYQGATSDYALVVDCADVCADPACGDRECGPAPGDFCAGFECGAGCADGTLCDDATGMCEAIPSCDDAAAGGELTCGAGPVTVTGDTTDMTSYVDEYVGCGAAGYGGPEVWYTYTAPCTGDVTFDLASPVADMALLVLEGTCRADFCVGGADNTVGAGDESVTIPAVEGTTYYIVVEGWLEEGNDVPSAGPFDLTMTCACTCEPDCSAVECGPDPICGQDCGGCGDGQVCSADGACVSDPCLGVTDIGCCDGDTSYTCTENGLVAEDCGADGCGWNDVFGIFFFYGCGGVGADPTGTYPIACDFAACDNTSFCAEQGWECGTGCPGESCGTCPEGEYCTADKTCAPVESCDAANDGGAVACGDGPQLTAGDTTDNANLILTYQCGFEYEGPEAWHTFVPSCTGDVTVSMTGPEGVDMDLLVLVGECSQAATCAGESTSGTSNESITFTADENETYYIVVEGYGADAFGAYELAVDCQCTCTPDCSATECGPDPVCGTDCGSCADGLVCDAGACVTDPCQGLTFDGCCLDGDVVWCEEGTIRTLRCGEDVALGACGWVDSGAGDGTGFFNCGGTDTPPAGVAVDCPELACDTTCAAEGLSCGPLPGCPWVDCGACDAGDACFEGACLPDPCLGVPSWNCCDGDTLNACAGGELVQADCTADGNICGWYGGDSQNAPGYYCAGADVVVPEEPTGSFPAACDLATCDNTAFCEAWGRQCGPGCPGETCGTCPEGESCDPTTFTCVAYDAKTCDTPAALACGDVISGSNALAENLMGVETTYETCGGYEESGGEDVYTFTLDTAQTVDIAITGLTADLDLYVLADTCLESDCLAASAGTSDELIEGFAAEAGVTYHVVVEGWGGATSDYELTLTCGDACVPDCTDLECGDDGCGGSCGDCADGEFCNAGVCETETAPAACLAATPLVCGDAVSGTNVGAPEGLNGYSCGGSSVDGGEVVYTVTVDVDRDVTIDVTGLTDDLELYVLAGACDPTACVAKSTQFGDEQATFPAVAGTTYYVVVDGYSGAQSAFDLAVTCATPCDPACAPGALCRDGACVDACNAPEAALTCDSGVTAGDTTDGVSRFDEYSCTTFDQSGPDHFYAFTAPADGTYAFSILSVTGDQDFELLLLDDACGGCLEYGDRELVVDATAGETYYLVVDGYQGAAGPYYLVTECAGQAVVVLTDTEFFPADLTVAVGTTVRWDNVGAAAHTVTSTASPAVFDSGAIEPGGSFTYTFDTAGSYPYASTGDGFGGTITVE